MKRLTCIDLFCGCGGFTLGMERAGFSILAAADSNQEAITVFRSNFPSVAHMFHQDLTTFAPTEMAQIIGAQEVDVIVGGPPCQGFSTVRQRDGSNSGPRMVQDKRRHLYRDFLRYVGFFKPKVFVMENVLGIKSAAGGKFFTKVQKEARAMGYRVHGQVERAAKLGVPQKRQRQLIIGTRSDIPGYFRGELEPSPRINVALDGTQGLKDQVTLWEAIGDLPPLAAGTGSEDSEYDAERFARQFRLYGGRYLLDVLEVAPHNKLTAHVARPHSDRDLRDFARLREGEHCTQAMKRGEHFEFPYDKKTFKDRYTRQHRNETCSTIVAHLSKDGLMFIHPTQARSLTAREAARVQSFPDWFQFPVPRTQQFRLIGNAVPPLVGESVGLAVKSYLDKTMNNNKPIPFMLQPLPADQNEAIQWLLALVRAVDTKTLRQVRAGEFKRGWYSVGFLYPGLHPDSALEHATELSSETDDFPEVRRVEPRLLTPFFVQSGWPVILAPVAEEAWRRYDAGELKEDELYCSEAVVAGMCCRNPDLIEGVRQERETILG
jgi:DNA (cytosine-5)-methyltransferase 1